jgi:uncharacterized membrane protein
MMTSNPIFVLTLLCLCIVAADYLARLPYLKEVGTALIVIIIGAILANLGIIPTAFNAPPLYDGIFTYITPLAIFFILLSVNLTSLKKAGLPMIGNFFLGSLATLAGTLIGMWAVSGRSSIGEQFNVIGGMYTATYIGGSINLNAVALHYGFVKEGTLYAAVNAVDNIWGSFWVAATIILPRLFKKILPTRRQSAASNTAAESYVEQPESLNPLSLSLLLALGFGTITVADTLKTLMPSIPSVIWLTTLALVLAQIPQVQRLKGNRVLGMFSVYLFLAVIGAYCDFRSLMQNGQLALTLLIFVGILISVHALVIFGIGYLLKQDWDVLGIASQANVGGSATALTCAQSLGRSDLALAAILIGALGNATGTYWGIAIAEILKRFY